jgi:acyl-CoA thioester hydrolase
MSQTSVVRHNADGRPVVETRFRVRYHETDAMGIVHHAAYLTWFEEGRSAFTRAIDYPYAQMEADGMLLAVAEVTARYHRPAHYDEEVIVATCLAEFPSRGMTFTYEVRRASDHALLVTGSTKHISLDAAEKTMRIPEEMRARILRGVSG